MKKLVLTGALLCLAACSGDDEVPADSGNSTGSVPAALAANLSSVQYLPASDRLTLQMTGLDAGSLESVYARTPGLDVGNYRAYTTQSDPLDRHFTALLDQSDDNALTAIVVQDGGQFNRYFYGTYYIRNGVYTPDTGLASYAGQYAGLTNVNSVSGSDLATLPAGADPTLAPGQATRVNGEVFVNVDFSENALNGEIYNRVLQLDETDATVTQAMPDVVLVLSTIDDNGEFTGAVEYDGVPDRSIGTYAGILGGDGSTSMAGVLHLDEWDGENGPLRSEQETGMFVLNQCASTNASGLCN